MESEPTPSYSKEYTISTIANKAHNERKGRNDRQESKEKIGEPIRDFLCSQFGSKCGGN